MAKSKSTKPAPQADSTAPLSYPADTEDRLCDVAGSVSGLVKLLEASPDGSLELDGGRLLSVLQMLQVIEREVRAIVHSAVELQEEVVRG